MEEVQNIKKPGPWATSLKWGVIFGLISIAVGLTGSLLTDYSSYETFKETNPQFLQYLGFVFMIGSVIVAQIQHRKKDLGGYMSYGRSVGVATISGLALGIVSAVYMLISMEFLFPEAFDYMKQLQIEKTLEWFPNATPEQEDQIIERTQNQSSLGSALPAILTFTFFSLVIGLISGIFTRKSEE